MKTIIIGKARIHFYSICKSCIYKDKVVRLSSKNGNVILLSEQKFNSLLESFYLFSNSCFVKTITDGVNTPLEECYKVNWK